MKRSNLIKIFSILIFSAFQSENSIRWEDNTELTWQDFKAKPDASSKYKAFTESGIYSYTGGVESDRIIVGVEAKFYKDASWTKDKTNINLLKHEQLHFTITELWARKFRQKLSTKKYSINTFNKIFQKDLTALSKEIFTQNKAMQTEYDTETEHSVNTVNQEKWNKKISSELQKLNAFSSIEVSCKLSK